MTRINIAWFPKSSLELLLCSNGMGTAGQSHRTPATRCHCKGRFWVTKLCLTPDRCALWQPHFGFSRSGCQDNHLRRAVIGQLEVSDLHSAVTGSEEIPKNQTQQRQEHHH